MPVRELLALSTPFFFGLVPLEAGGLAANYSATWDQVLSSSSEFAAVKSVQAPAAHRSCSSKLSSNPWCYQSYWLCLGPLQIAVPSVDTLPLGSAAAGQGGLCGRVGAQDSRAAPPRL